MHKTGLQLLPNTCVPEADLVALAVFVIAVLFSTAFPWSQRFTEECLGGSACLWGWDLSASGGATAPHQLRVRSPYLSTAHFP